MENGSLNTSFAFEIPVHEAGLQSPRTPKLLNRSSLNKSVADEADLSLRLAKADERRCKVLSETRSKNEANVIRAKSRCLKEKEKLGNRSLEILECLEDDLQRKSQKRDQILQERISVAKKEFEKVEHAASVRSSPREDLMRLIDEDMTNKENKRRSHLLSIKQQCQQEYHNLCAERHVRDVYLRGSMHQFRPVDQMSPRLGSKTNLCSQTLIRPLESIASGKWSCTLARTVFAFLCSRSIFSGIAVLTKSFLPIVE